MWLFWCNCQKWCQVWKTRVWHFILCSALEDAAPQPSESTQGRAFSAALSYWFCWGNLWVLCLLLGTELWADQKKWHLYDLCVKLTGCTCCFGGQWLPKQTARKEPLLQGGKCSSHTLETLFFPLLCFNINQTQMHLNMSRHDIQQFCIKLITINLII